MSFLINSYAYGGGTAIPTGNLVLYTRHGSSRTTDETGNCTITDSGTGTSTGLYDSAANGATDFPGGANDYLNVNYNSVFDFVDGGGDLPFSVSLAVNVDNVGANDFFVCWGGTAQAPNQSIQWECFVRNDSSNYKPRFWIYDYTGTTQNGRIAITSNDTISLSTNVHLVFTYDGSATEGGMKIYINGAEATSYTSDSSGSYSGMSGVNDPLTIGNRGFNRVVSANAYDGRQDGLGIWDKELTAAEVTAIYNEQSAGNELL